MHACMHRQVPTELRPTDRRNQQQPPHIITNSHISITFAMTRRKEEKKIITPFSTSSDQPIESTEKPSSSLPTFFCRA